jgi:hypothetical protein
VWRGASAASVAVTLPLRRVSTATATVCICAEGGGSIRVDDEKGGEGSVWSGVVPDGGVSFRSSGQWTAVSFDAIRCSSGSRAWTTEDEYGPGGAWRCLVRVPHAE